MADRLHDLHAFDERGFITMFEVAEFFNDLNLF